MIRNICAVVIILLTSLLANQLAIGQPALRHEQEDVAGGPMKVERVKEGLYLIRGTNDFL